MKKFDYNNKIAIVTGATSGIGYEIARTLIQKYNCKVYGIARSVKKLEHLREELGPHNFLCCTMDVSDRCSWEKLRVYFETQNEHPDILINCAGILPKFASVNNTSIENIEKAMDVNFMSCVYSCKIIMPIMNKGGMVVNVSSASALCSFGGISAYSASKSALLRFSEALSCEQKDLSVSCVMPGFVKTDIMKEQGATKKDEKLIGKVSADPQKTVKKLLWRTGKRKKRIVLGFDGHIMSIMYRLFPRLAPKLFTRVIKKSRLEIFKEI
ncbi:MAG: SDR family NAD(P)-dependent oxidoreductase [Clostridia bacterium]|nr:SDR family NAD(P)-dependent oxidoreductase [Clostridia bacterium]